MGIIICGWIVERVRVVEKQTISPQLLFPLSHQLDRHVGIPFFGPETENRVDAYSSGD